LSALDRLGLQLYKQLRFVDRNARRLIGDPRALIDLLRGPPPRHYDGAHLARIPPLHLVPGELVRIKPLDQIEATLDEEGKYRGLSFMSLMRQHCGELHTVSKRVGRFFDERTRTLLKLRDVVILDDVYCVPPLEGQHEYAGCDRTCFFFWKEAWLERASAKPI
jgi:hypothetical protein